MYMMCILIVACVLWAVLHILCMWRKEWWERCWQVSRMQNTMTSQRTRKFLIAFFLLQALREHEATGLGTSGAGQVWGWLPVVCTSSARRCCEKWQAILPAHAARDEWSHGVLCRWTNQQTLKLLIQIIIKENNQNSEPNVFIHLFVDVCQTNFSACARVCINRKIRGGLFNSHIGRGLPHS